MSVKFHKINLPDVSDLIIAQILDLLKRGQLQPGEQLPSETTLQQEFAVSKQQLKTAFKRLEIYGVLETKPQAGTFVADFNLKILISLVANIMDINKKPSPASLLETRILLEVRAVELACSQISPGSMAKLEEANAAYLAMVHKRQSAVELDMLFHMEIVHGSGNSTLISLYSFITKDLISLWHEFECMDSNRLEETEEEHLAILDALKAADPQRAGEAMKNHLMAVYNESKKAFSP